MKREGRRGWWSSSSVSRIVIKKNSDRNSFILLCVYVRVTNWTKLDVDSYWIALIVPDTPGWILLEWKVKVLFSPNKKKGQKKKTSIQSINNWHVMIEINYFYWMFVRARVCVCVSTFQFYLMYTIDNRWEIMKWGSWFSLSKNDCIFVTINKHDKSISFMSIFDVTFTCRLLSHAYDLLLSSHFGLVVVCILGLLISSSTHSSFWHSK